MSSANNRSEMLIGSMFPNTIVSLKPKRKHEEKTVIAHISDLHFTESTNFNGSPWDALLSDLKANERGGIDLLVVTGDLIDSPAKNFVKEIGKKIVNPIVKFFRSGSDNTSSDEISQAFTKVSNYLTTLCSALDIDPQQGLFVVPGNHDYRVAGIGKSRTQPQKFCNQFKDYCRPLLLPTLNVCVFTLDSNVMEFLDLASARIDTSDFVKFFNLTQQVPPEYSNFTKIVLLHHHPMPISATEREGFLNNPGFTMLKNAGQFMTTMVASKIDLVLHGHEHYPAYSKAFFPYGKGLQEHLITVISAGSVGKGVGNYNLITITDNGQIHLERRSYANHVIYDQEYDKQLRNYEDARRAIFEENAVVARARLRAEKSSRLYIIKSGSGDADLHERSENIRAYSSEVDEWTTFFSSQSSFFFTPVFDTPRVRWEWVENSQPGVGESSSNVAAPTDSGVENIPSGVEKREAKVIFDPPLTKDSPISFNRFSKSYNLFQFNQQDRLDISNDEHKRESYSLTLLNAFDIFTVTLCFPKSNFPDVFDYKVKDMKGNADPFERDYFVKHLSAFKESGLVTFTLEKPLPGYRYEIIWELPPLEEDELKLSGADRDQADDAVNRLLDAANQPIVKQWLDSLRQVVTTAQMWTELRGGNDIEMSLYVYDRAQKGLVCVATTLQANNFITPWGGIIKPGVTLIGEAYRRRGPAFYNPLARAIFDQLEYKDRIPKSWQQATPLGKKYIAACALPLFCPLLRGRRIAVLSFASKANGSRLLRLLPDKNDNENLREDKKARQKTLIEIVIGRQNFELLESLGVQGIGVAPAS